MRRVAGELKRDVAAAHDRDPAARGVGSLQILAAWPGVQALLAHRLAHALCQHRFPGPARMLALVSRSITNIEIHPRAQIGDALFIDHGTGVVIGETAVVEDGVSMLHGVTLGGTGKERGDRHPKVRRGVLLGAGAKVLGNIEIGACAKIAAGSVVLEPVPAGCTAAGVPARIIGCVDVPEPALEMDQRI
jgi:serine O-acetyltransferase